MKLVPDAAFVARKAHSMWAFYLGILCLNAPDLIYWTLEVDTNPALWTLIGNALFAYGIIGRLIDQNPKSPEAKS